MKKIIVLDISDIRVKKNGDKYNITPESNIEIIMSEEAMTANFAELDLEKVKALAQEILIDKNISAVFYDITNKPPATIEWEQTNSKATE